MPDDNLENNISEAAAAAGGPAEAGSDPALTEEQRLQLRRKQAMSSAVDDADASHQGGLGAQGAAVDFGKPKNFGLPD